MRNWWLRRFSLRHAVNWDQQCRRLRISVDSSYGARRQWC